MDKLPKHVPFMIRYAATFAWVCAALFAVNVPSPWLRGLSVGAALLNAIFAYRRESKQDNSNG